MTGLWTFLVHPWQWHRQPRPFRVNLYRSFIEVAAACAAAAVLAAWPWSPVWPLAARIGLAVFYSIAAVVTIITMRVAVRPVAHPPSGPGRPALRDSDEPVP